MGTATEQTLAKVVDDELVRYFRHLASRVERAIRSLPPEKLWTRPFAYGNSVGHLVLHLTGNLNHYIGARIAGTGYVRDRPLEFTETRHEEPAVMLQRFQAAVELVVRTIQSLDAAGLSAPVTNEQPIETQFGMFLVCAAHMNNHIGQMSYLVRALGHSTEEPPVW
jgi:uncharacterized damage-inducible protein DinB